MFICCCVNSLSPYIISHPVMHTHTNPLQSPPLVSSFSQRFSPGNPLDFPPLSSMFKCTAIQSPQNSAKNWAVLLSNPLFRMWKLHDWDDRLLNWAVAFCVGLFLAGGSVLVSLGTVGKAALCEQTPQWQSNGQEGVEWHQQVLPNQSTCPFFAWWTES